MVSTCCTCDITYFNDKFDNGPLVNTTTNHQRLSDKKRDVQTRT